MFEIIIIIIALFIVFLTSVKCYKSKLAKEQIGLIILSGQSSYKMDLALYVSVFIYFCLYSINGWLSFAFIIPVFILETFRGGFFLGEKGIKVGDQFIPKSDIVSCYRVGNSVNKFDLFVKGSDKSIRVTIDKKMVSDGMEEIMVSYTAQAHIT